MAEPGVDEGGLQKEFFQLIIRQIFDVNYGMFLYNEETRVFWFNTHSFEPNIKFELIGSILGLAIYNSVILDIHFPLIIYKKLLNQPIKFEVICKTQISRMYTDLGSKRILSDTLSFLKSTFGLQGR